MSVLPADPRVLGSTLTDGGCNFAIWSNAATAVELCLFNEVNGKLVETRFALSHRNGPIWHGYLAGVRAGQRYGYRVYGTWAPEYGSRFNAAKLLIDPYAHKLDGELQYTAEIYGHVALDGTGAGDTNVRDDRDSAGFVPYSVVTDYRAREIERPIYSWTQEVIYEAHVRGLTKMHPGVPLELRGTYAGLGHETMTTYLKDLGVTAVELLPVHAFLSEEHLLRQGTTNYWGYNTLNFFTPHEAYATQAARAEGPSAVLREFKQMVKDLHDAGLEVILDVVYNHTAEEGKGGPRLSFRGLDNASYYRQDEDGNYIDTTGCGNSLNASMPVVQQLILDSLRYWAEETQVDGFRFDLMGILDVTTMQQVRAALDEIDPSIIVIGEGWSMGAAIPDGTAATQGQSANLSGIGFFNDQFRDAVKGSVFNKTEAGYVNGAASIKHDDAKVGILGNTGRTGATVGNWTAYDPGQSVNYAEAHDNLTLFDKLKASMVGAKPAAIVAANKMAAVFVFTSQGLPFMQAGQEFMRSKYGDDNSYQSSDLVNSLKWATQIDNADVRNYYKGLIALRKAHPAFRMDTSEKIAANVTNWTPGTTDALGYLINGTGAGETAAGWSSIYVAHNGTKKPVTITLPSSGTWTIVVNGSKAGVGSLGTVVGTKLVVPAGVSMVLHK